MQVLLCDAVRGVLCTKPVYPFFSSAMQICPSSISTFLVFEGWFRALVYGFVLLENVIYPAEVRERADGGYLRACVLSREATGTLDLLVRLQVKIGKLKIEKFTGFFFATPPPTSSHCRPRFCFAFSRPRVHQPLEITRDQQRRQARGERDMGGTTALTALTDQCV